MMSLEIDGAYGLKRIELKAPALKELCIGVSQHYENVPFPMLC